MITDLSLKSFKCFKDLDLKLEPLTVLSGMNSSGKSSVIQALRILKTGAIPPGHGTARDLKNVDSSELPQLEVAFSDGDKEGKCELQLVDGPAHAHEGCAAIASMIYLSADRLGPRANLPYSEYATDAGEQGELVYSLLQANRDLAGVPELLRYEDKKELSGVFEQIRAWLGLVAPGEQFDFNAYEKAGVAAGSFSQFKAKNVGFGLSYTLPIIATVIVLAARIARGEIRDALLLLENPEAHLHPAGQTRIGFFLALASACGVQCLVETHSEHVINGIRIAVKEKKITPDDVIFYFFEKEEDGSEVVEIRADGYGMLDRWPAGFFDESENALRRLL